MTGRQRILATLDRKPADCIPLDIGGTDCSSVHVVPYKKLRELLGMADGPFDCGCLIQLVAQTEPTVMDALGTDVEALWFSGKRKKLWKAPLGVDLFVPELFDVEDLPDGSSVVRNPQGVVYAKRAADAYYHDPVGAPLGHITAAAELDQFDTLFDRWDYSYVYDEPLDALARRAKEQYESTDRAVVTLWRLHYFQAGMLMRGYERFMIDIMIDKDLAHAVMAKLHRAYMDRVDALLDALGDYVDIVFLTDDLGTQKGSMISPAVYREIIFPYIAEVVGKIKAAGKRVVMHSCGAVSDFIPAMIEMGVDALNPVQVSAAGMNPSELAKQYGRDIAFWGGGCDTQHALNAADPEVVRADVRRRLEEFGPDAHLVFTQVHNIQYDVSPENILAMRDEFWKQTRE